MCLISLFRKNLLSALAEKKEEKATNKQNSFYLIDFSTFSLSLKRYSWVGFRKTKLGVNLYLKLYFLYNETMYPADFIMTTAKEHDVNQLENLVD